LGWRQERLAKNAEEISKLGKELYERISKLADHVVGLGRHLGQTVEAYNTAIGSLENRVLVSARRFRDLGASAGDEIEGLNPVEKSPRTTQAIELLRRSPGGAMVPDNQDAMTSAEIEVARVEL
jgi:DNA recombination protein RmuC